MRALARRRGIAIAASLIVCAAACSPDPHATRLPTDPKDVAKVQPQLNRLPPDERQLVLDYLARSQGTVLPTHLADPDAPLTAATFGEAIKLQRKYAFKHAADTATMEKVRAAREAGFQPLRKALQVELVQREILPFDQVSGRQPMPGQAINDKPVLVNTFRLRNTSAETITQAAGSVKVRAVSDPAALTTLADCYITRGEPIEAGQSVEMRCANLAVRASAADQEYVAMPGSTLVLTWEPQSITFASGTVLKPSW
jgi:hypothetical protein